MVQISKDRVGWQLAAACVIWVSALLWGAGSLWGHARQPGEAGSAPLFWPQQSRIQPEPGLPTLVMMAHPQCACTKASLCELARLMTQLQGRLRAFVIFYQPAAFPASWVETDSWQAAHHIPGVTVMRDDGCEASLFRSHTSGQTLLYDAEGNLRFSGGITWARAHSGDNAGSTAITEIVLRGSSQQARSPVFGCAIFNQSSAPEGGK